MTKKNKITLIAVLILLILFSGSILYYFSKGNKNDSLSEPPHIESNENYDISTATYDEYVTHILQSSLEGSPFEKISSDKQDVAVNLCYTSTIQDSFAYAPNPSNSEGVFSDEEDTLDAKFKFSAKKNGYYLFPIYYYLTSSSPIKIDSFELKDSKTDTKLDIMPELSTLFNAKPREGVLAGLVVYKVPYDLMDYSNFKYDQTLSINGETYQKQIVYREET